MPATVHVSESTRTSMRIILVIAALVALLIPVAFSVAHGASRLNYERIDVTEPISESATDLKFVLDTGAAVVVKTSDVDTPSVKLTATGRKDDAPSLRVDDSGRTSTVSIDDRRNLENSRIEVTVPARTSKAMKLDFNGGYGAVDVNGDYREIIADTDGGAVDIDGSARRLQTSTDYGATHLQGEFDSIEAKTGVGTLDGANLVVRDRVDAVTSTGTIDLDFSNDAAPMSGIVAKAEEGTIDLRLPRLELAQEKMDADPKELFYRINANSSQGEVDLAKDLKKYDSSKGSKAAKGKTVIPVSVSADTGAITIEQN